MLNWTGNQRIYFKQFFDPFQCRFSTWLSEKEDAMKKIQTNGFKDQNEMVSSLQKISVGVFFFPSFLKHNNIIIIF